MCKTGRVDGRGKEMIIYETLEKAAVGICRSFVNASMCVIRRKRMAGNGACRGCKCGDCRENA